MRGRPFRFEDLGGGVNFKDADYLIDENQARDVLNVVSTTRGAVRSRDGALLFQSGAAVTGLFGVEETTAPRLLVSRAAKVDALDASGAVVVTDTLSAGRFEWVSAPPNSGQGPIYGMDGTSARYFTGSAFGAWTASAGTLPVGRFLSQWELRTIVTGRISSPSSVYASDVGDPRNWDTTTNAWEVQLDPSDGRAITGVGLIGPYLIAFKPAKVFVLNDSATGANRRLSGNVGCVANRSIAASPYGLFFLSEDGVYLTDGNDLDRVSDAIDPLLARIIPSQRSVAAGAFINDRYFLSITTVGTANNLTLEYDPRKKAWWIHDLATPQWTAWRRVDTPELIGARAGDTFHAFVPGVALDMGDEFNSFWKSGWKAFKTPFLRKRCRAVHFDGDGVFDLYVSKDFATTDTAWGSVDFAALNGTFGGTGVLGGPGTFGGARTVNESKVFSPGVARAWSVVFTGPGPFEVDSYTFFMTERKN